MIFEKARPWGREKRGEMKNNDVRMPAVKRGEGRSAQNILLRGHL